MLLWTLSPGPRGKLFFIVKRNQLYEHSNLIASIILLQLHNFTVYCVILQIMM